MMGIIIEFREKRFSWNNFPVINSTLLQRSSLGKLFINCHKVFWRSGVVHANRGCYHGKSQTLQMLFFHREKSPIYPFYFVRHPSLFGYFCHFPMFDIWFENSTPFFDTWLVFESWDQETWLRLTSISGHWPSTLAPFQANPIFFQHLCCVFSFLTFFPCRVQSGRQAGYPHAFYYF